MTQRTIPITNEINAFMHCRLCIEELPAGESPRSYARFDVGWTRLGLQVWCIRHEVNVLNIVSVSVTLPPPQDPLGYSDEELRSFMSADEWTAFGRWMTGQTVGVGEDGKPRTFPWDAKRGLELIRFGRPTYFD